jgi:hypothetical protein
MSSQIGQVPISLLAISFISTTTTLSGTANMTPSANTWTAATPLTVTLGSSFTNLIVFIWTENAAAQNNTLQLTNVQLEPGASKLILIAVLIH